MYAATPCNGEADHSDASHGSDNHRPRRPATMSTIAVAPAEAVAQLHEELDRTRVGRRWQRLYHAHEREVEALAVVHYDVRDHLADAAVRLADATETRVLDPDTVRAASRVLDDLNRLGT